MNLYLYLDRGFGEVNTLTEALSDVRFYAPIYRTVATTCLERGWELTARLSRAPGDMLRECREGKPDAILFNGHDLGPELEDFLARRAASIPVVHLSSPWLEPPFLGARIDDGRGFRTLTRHLAQEGFTRVDFVRAVTTADRFEETRRAHVALACAELGLPAPRTFAIDWTAHTPPRWLTASDRPEAVICSNDTLAERVLVTSRLAGLRVPEDLAVCGSNGFLRGAKGPAVTTMEFDFARVARAALDLIEARRSTGAPPAESTVLVPPTFRLGDTSLRRTLGMKERHAAFSRAALEVLETRFADRDCLKRAAQACGVGVVHFQRRFKEIHGESFTRKWIEFRLDRVARGLRNTSTPVKDLAAEAGFRNTGAFYRAFEKKHGGSPTAFRRETAEGGRR